MILYVKHLNQKTRALNGLSTSGLGCNYGFRMIQVMLCDNTFLSSPSGTKRLSNLCSSKISKLHIWKPPNSKGFQKSSLVALAGSVATHGFQRWPSELDKRTVNTGLSKIASKTQQKQHEKTGLVALLTVDGHPWLDTFGWYCTIWELAIFVAIATESYVCTSVDCTWSIRTTTSTSSGDTCIQQPSPLIFACSIIFNSLAFISMRDFFEVGG